MPSRSTRSNATNQPTSTFRRSGARTCLSLAAACGAIVLSAQPAIAQATYEYVGNPFTLFSCGPSTPGPGTINCSTPAPSNPNTSYTATDHVEATLVLTDPLPANMPLQDVRTFPGFSLTMSDGQHSVSNAIAAGMFAEVSTDVNGDILQWRLVINTGGLANGGIATQNAAFVSDSGTLACCDPVVPGNLARNSGIPGVWSSGAPTPEALVVNLINVIADPLLGLSDGQVNSLTSKLDNARASIEEGLNKQARNQVQALINSIKNSVKNGKMSEEVHTTIVNAARAIIAAL